MADPGWDLKDVASSPLSRCAFCLQAVIDAPRTVCGRCRAIYHPDCWRANDERCAVYGCVPAPEPEPRRLRRPVVVPAPVLTSAGNGSSWRFLVVPLVIVLANVARLSSQSSTPAAPRPVFPVQVSRPWTEQTLEEQAIRDARRFLRILEDAEVPAAGPVRSALQREADLVADKLQRARDRYALSSIVSTDTNERLKALTELSDQVQRKRVELSDP